MSLCYLSFEDRRKGMLSWGNVEGKEKIEDKPWRMFKSQVE